MKKIIEYRVITDVVVPRLNENVNKMIQAGWQPMGDAKPVIQGGIIMMSQTMVRYED